jgi:hypothetical protein
MSRKSLARVALVVLLGGGLLVQAPETHAINNAQYAWCVFNCSNPLTRRACILACKKRYRAQKHWINLFNVSATSSGYGELYGSPYMAVLPGEPITVDLDVDNPDVLSSVSFYLFRYGVDPIPPDPPLPSQMGTLVGFDDDPTDGWSITFDSTPFGAFSGVLIAWPSFWAGAPPENSEDVDIIYCTTEGTPSGPPRYIDLNAGSLQLTTLPGNEVQVQVACSAIVGGPDIIAPVSTVARVIIDDVPVADIPLDVDIPPVVSPCALSVPPGCAGDCPSPATFCTGVDLWGTGYDYCGCEYPVTLVGTVSASPGARIIVVLDDDDVVPEADEENNWVEGFAPQEAIPTLSEWGLILMSLLLLTGGVIFLIRRHRGAARGFA